MIEVTELGWIETGPIEKNCRHFEVPGCIYNVNSIDLHDLDKIPLERIPVVLSGGRFSSCRRVFMDLSPKSRVWEKIVSPYLMRRMELGVL